jgi:hypothetical protein
MSGYVMGARHGHEQEKRAFTMDDDKECTIDLNTINMIITRITF